MASGEFSSTRGVVRIEGLTQFRQALKVAGDRFPEQMRAANFEAASKIVEFAKAEAETVSIRTPTKAAKSLRASKAVSYSSIRGGGPAFPYFYGAEFGAKRYHQFLPWRGNQWTGWDSGVGYFLHPAIRKEGRQVVADYMHKIDVLTRMAFPT